MLHPLCYCGVHENTTAPPPNVNRRMFLSAGTTAAVAGTVGLCTSRKSLAQQPGPNPNVYAAASAAHCIASGAGFYSSPTAHQWTTIGNTMQSVLNDWQLNQLDAQVRPAAYRVSPSMVKSSNINQQAILQQIQLFEPAFQLSDVQQSLSFIDNASQSQIQSVITVLQQQGLAPYLQSCISQSSLIAAQLPGTTTNAQGIIPGFSSDAARAEPPPPNEGGGYNCQTDGALVWTAGVAFGVLTVMTGGTDILVMGFWGGFVYWGGTATVAWGAGHNIAGCGF